MRIGKQLIRAGKLWALDIPPETPKTNKLSTFRSPRTCRDESMHTCKNFDFAFLALMDMMDYGLETNGGQ
jgi:hypothetical protein